MILKDIVIFDFDGVIVDGLIEYWDSAKKACLQSIKKNELAHTLPSKVPTTFRQLRPWVKNGWEMVLIAAEIFRQDSPLAQHGPIQFAENYQQNCIESLKTWGWNSEQLQNALDNVRKQEIITNKDTWLARHVPFQGIIERIQRLQDEEIAFGVLTTKSAEFTLELLKSFNLHPALLYGHESGEKKDLLLQISKSHSIKGFIEDRRATLETIINTPDLSFIPCYLASWGYLKSSDTQNLPPGIHLLQPENFMSALTNWS